MHLTHYTRVKPTKGSPIGGRSYTYRRDGVTQQRTEYVAETTNGELHRVVPFYRVDENYVISKKDIVFLGEPVFAPDEKKD